MNIKLIISIIIVIGVIACRKDKVDSIVAEEDKECYSFDLPGPLFPTYSEERFQYRAPYFNPNNSDEFIYHFRDNEQNIFHLLKYNIQTKQKTLIAESGKIWRQPKWSSNGWIAYTHHEGYVDHIYVVKDNGDSLIQFTENVSNMYPAWSSTGDELYWMYTPNLGVPYYFLKQNLNVSSPDTLSKYGDAYNGYLRYNAISLSNNKLSSLVFINDEAHLAIASLNEAPFSFSSIANMNNVFDHPSVNGLCWSSDGESVFVTSKNGLYKVGVNNGNSELLIPFCDSKSYASISASSDGKYLIGARGNNYLEKDEENNPTGVIMTASSIYLIDLHTLEETKIELEP